MKKTTLHSYNKRLMRVIEYIHQHLDSDLSVNTLAEVAMMSPYHFHRIYRGLAQENLNATIRRIRLQSAAVRLLHSQKPILHIAKQVGYGSQEAFSRAFALLYGETPHAYRQKRRQDVSRYIPPALLTDLSSSQEYNTMYQVEVMDMPSMHLLAHPHQGDYLKIGKVFEKLAVYAHSHQLLNEKTYMVGLYYDDPQSTPVDELRSVAAMNLDGKALPADLGGLEVMDTPAGKCASFQVKGSYAELPQAYNWFFESWLPQSGYEIADFPSIEVYLNDPRNTPQNELLTRISCLLVD